MSRFLTPMTALIGANCAVFAGWTVAEKDYTLRNFMRRNFTISHDGIVRELKLHTLLTSFFSHQEAWHFGFNMLALYSFGQNALYSLGNRQFLALYFGGGMFSSVCFTIWPHLIPKSWPAYYNYDIRASACGASGAVNAVVMWSVCSFPRSLIYVYGVLPLPAAVVGLGFVAFDGYSLFKGSTGGIGNSAHLGGAAFGLAFFALGKLSRRFIRRF